MFTFFPEPTPYYAGEAGIIEVHNEKDFPLIIITRGRWIIFKINHNPCKGCFPRIGKQHQSFI